MTAEQRVREFVAAYQEQGSPDLIATQMYHGGMCAECAVLHLSDLVELLNDRPAGEL